MNIHELLGLTLVILYLTPGRQTINLIPVNDYVTLTSMYTVYLIISVDDKLCAYFITLHSINAWVWLAPGNPVFNPCLDDQQFNP